MSLLRDARGGRRAPGRGTVRTWVLVALLVIGVWTSIAPFVLEYGTTDGPSRAVVNDSVVGVTVVGLALIGLCRPGR
jgi:hypothetical protein